MRSGEEIQAALGSFVERWKTYHGTERAEAQTFLNELFDCYGTDRSASGAKFEDFKSSAGFMDLHWPGTCIVEMKAPDKPLTAARDQVKRYWEESADEDRQIPAAQWVIISNFQSFEVWEPGRFPKSPRATVSIHDLPRRYEILLFLAGPAETPSFLEHHKELTTAAAHAVASVYQSLVDRSAAPPDEITRFTMQAVWTLFAEDLNLIAGSPFQNIIERLRRDASRSPAAEIGFLFRVLNQKGNHNRKDLLSGTRYVNGELFANPAEVDLNREELDLLAQAAVFDWGKVEPTIFGSLLESVIGRDRRWELGAHYTHEADILKIVGPTIIRPWQARIDELATPSEALQLLRELCQFRVLDPACGCGNFLYVSYRELRGLEARIKQKIVELAAITGNPVPSQPWPYVPLTNFYGIDIEPVAVLIARVTLWMGHRQMLDLYGEAENPLPLINLSGIRVADAVFSEWPDVDCIVGNPPFLGDRLIRRAHGADYIERLKRIFNVGVVDYSAYWFRRAQDQLVDGQRAGFVSTNTLRENKHRLASLDYILQTGGTITDAVSSQKWPGEARVHVSITNWIKGNADSTAKFTLDGAIVEGITSQLRQGSTRAEPPTLPANRGVSFIGCQPSGSGFLLSDSEAAALIEAGEADVVRRYLTSDDLTDSIAAEPRRWIIDFGTMALEDAMKYPKALTKIRKDVKPERDVNNQRHFARLWWQFAWPRPKMREALSGRSRFIVCTLTGKRFLVSWASKEWCPSNLVGVFSLDDDYSIGVLLSRAHRAWAWHRSSTFETRLRYTPSTAFETFPWPTSPDGTSKERVADAARALLAERSRISNEYKIGLTTLYNRMDEGAFDNLRRLQSSLDEAVVGCYSWEKAAAYSDDIVVMNLLALNEQVSQGNLPYSPFVS
ncbi:DNA methyltransferase [Pseudonocardia benzenivorans]|uniref:site-specific DNA-methyltransferase (adenine-specific) n=1 Tax=Pseudonocardia benzenivorans TaxID=228005 RepID=A0ABW3V8Q7_9PSEU